MLIQAWKSNQTPIKLLDELTYPLPNFNGCRWSLEIDKEFTQKIAKDIITDNSEYFSTPKSYINILLYVSVFSKFVIPINDYFLYTEWWLFYRILQSDQWNIFQSRCCFTEINSNKQSMQKCLIHFWNVYGIHIIRYLHIWDNRVITHAPLIKIYWFFHVLI